MKLTVTVLLCLFSFSFFAQDMIVHKSGSKINCKITDVDSVFISYTLPRVKGKMRLRMTEVESYQIATPSTSKPQIKTIGQFTSTPIVSFVVEGGLCNAIDDFGDSDLNNGAAGLARDGYFIQPSAHFHIVKFLTIGLLYRMQDNPVDIASLKSLYTAVYPHAGWEMSSTSWKGRGFFGSIGADLPLNKTKRIYVHMGLNIGFPKYTSPQLVISGSPFGGRVTVTQQAATSSALTVMSSLAFQYRLTPAAAVSLNFGYLGASPKFSVVSSSTNGTSSYDTFVQKISCFDIGIGLKVTINQER